MADLQSQIAITADVTGVETGIGKAKRSLADMASAAKTAGAQASQGLAGAGNGGTEAAVKIDRATQSIINSIQRASATAAAGGKATSDYFRALADQRGISGDALKPYLEQLDQVSAKTTTATHASSGFTREAVVLAHELSQGNFSRFGGSLLVMAEYSTKATAALGALLSPAGVAAAAIAAIGYEAYKGGKELDALSKSLALTGNFSGLTGDSFKSLAKDIASDVNVSVGSAKQALQELASTGAFGPSLLRPAADTAEQLSKLSGQSTEEIVANFAKMQDGVAKWAAEANKSYHFLDTATYEYIRTLEEQGRTEEAELVTIKALYAHIGGDAPAAVGVLAQAWHALKGTISDAVEAAKGITFDRTLGQQGEALKSQIALLQGLQTKGTAATLFAGLTPGMRDEQIPKLQEQLRLINQATGAQQDLANASAKVDATHAAGIKASDFLHRLQDEAKGADKLKRALEELHRQQDAFDADNPGNKLTAAQRAAQEQIVRDQNKPAAGASPVNVDKSSLQAQLQAIKDSERVKLDAYKDAAAEFNALRSAGLVSDKAYYEQRRIDLELDEAAQLKSIADQKAALLAKNFTGHNAANEEYQRTKDLGKLDADRTKVMADTASKAKQLGTEETAANHKRAAGYDELDQASARAFEQIRRQYDLELSLSKLGPEAAARLRDRAQITGKYADQLQQANDDYSRLPKGKDDKVNPDDQDAYDKRVARIQASQAKELALYDENYGKRKAMDADYLTGFDRATASYVENAQNVAKLTENAYTSAFSGIEDSLASFVTTGRGNFKQLAESIISDIARMEAKAALSKVLGASSAGGSFSAIGLLGSVVGAFSGTAGTAAVASSMSGDSLDNFLALNGNFHRATGGPVNAGKLYEVNEKGPELLETGGHQYLMMGRQAGNVVPNGGSSGGSGGSANTGAGRIDMSGSTYNVGQGVSMGQVQAAIARSQAEAEQRWRRLTRNGNV